MSTDYSTITVSGHDIEAIAKALAVMPGLHNSKYDGWTKMNGTIVQDVGGYIICDVEWNDGWWCDFSRYGKDAPV